MPANYVPDESLLPSLQVIVFLLYPHMTQREREKERERKRKKEGRGRRERKKGKEKKGKKRKGKEGMKERNTFHIFLFATFATVVL